VRAAGLLGGEGQRSGDRTTVARSELDVEPAAIFGFLIRFSVSGYLRQGLRAAFCVFCDITSA